MCVIIIFVHRPCVIISKESVITPLFCPSHVYTLFALWGRYWWFYGGGHLEELFNMVVLPNIKLLVPVSLIKKIFSFLTLNQMKPFPNQMKPFHKITNQHNSKNGLGVRPRTMSSLFVLWKPWSNCLLMHISKRKHLGQFINEYKLTKTVIGKQTTFRRLFWWQSKLWQQKWQRVWLVPKDDGLDIQWHLVWTLREYINNV